MYSKETLKLMNKDIKVKKFLKLIYRDFDENNEYIRIFQNDNDNNMKEKYFNDIDSVVNYVIGKNKYNKNTYFELATTNGNSGQTEDLLYRYCLGFDFDKKDLGEDFNHIDVLNKFMQLKIHFHALIDTGHGYHAYICINKTNDFEKVQKVQEVLCNKLGADKQAIKSTQLMRIPLTFNVKNTDKVELVKIVGMDDRSDEQFKPYNIDYLYEKNCTIKELNKLDNDKKNTKYILDNTNIPPCIEKIINEGSPIGQRYEDLKKIVVNLRNRNRKINEIISVCKIWADKSNYDKDLKKEITNIYNKLNYAPNMECKKCNNKKNCFHYTESEFDFDGLHDEDGVIYPTYQIEEKISKKIRNKKNGSVNMLSGNEILILSILRNEFENPRPLTANGMDFKLLMKTLTCKKVSCLSEKTTKDTLNKLIDKNFILENVGSRNKKYYKINPIRATLDKTIKVSFMATCMCIARNITPDELALYILMRQIHKEQLQENKARGNLFVLSQSDIAKRYYGNNATENKTHISKMIKNLIEYHILDIYEIGISKNNNYEYYKYRMNC